MSLSLSLSLSSMPPPVLPGVMHLFSLEEKGRARALKYDLIIPYLFVRPFFCGFDRGYVAVSAFAASSKNFFDCFDPIIPRAQKAHRLRELGKAYQSLTFRSM